MARELSVTGVTESLVQDKENMIQDLTLISDNLVSNSEGQGNESAKPLEIVEVKYGKKWWVCEVTSRKRGGACWVRFQEDGSTLRIPPTNVDSHMRPLSLSESEGNTTDSVARQPLKDSSSPRKRPKVYKKKSKDDGDIPCQVFFKISIS